MALRLTMLLCLVGLLPAPSRGDEPAPPAKSRPWIGKLAGGPYFSAEGLKKILESHKLGGPDGVLVKADLHGADLHGADLRRANLSGSLLDGADLEEAELAGATLAGASLMNANLKKSVLNGANLSGAALQWAELQDAKLYGADLSGADLSQANFNRANLAVANLRGAILSGTHMNGAYLLGANLSETQLSGTDLSSADLAGADFRAAKMDGAILAAAIVFDLNLAGASFDVDTSSPLPDAGQLATAKGLASLTYDKAPTALIELREAFAKAGLSGPASEVNFAILHQRRLRAEGVEKIGLLAIELPCAFGLRPARPLKLLLCGIILFTIPYFVALGRSSGAGVWITWPEDRAVKNEAVEKNARLEPHGLRRLGWAVYFSILSAFNVGWEDINIGTWIARIQPRE
ncbi:MAG TPA: pentapeptide repeat-containing protein, partial [Opitutaceae bacterium]